MRSTGLRWPWVAAYAASLRRRLGYCLPGRFAKTSDLAKQVGTANRPRWLIQTGSAVATHLVCSPANRAAETDKFRGRACSGHELQAHAAFGFAHNLQSFGILGDQGFHRASCFIPQEVLLRDADDALGKVQGLVHQIRRFNRVRR